jgi:hypothetical protein
MVIAESTPSARPVATPTAMAGYHTICQPLDAVAYLAAHVPADSHLPLRLASAHWLAGLAREEGLPSLAHEPGGFGLPVATPVLCSILNLATIA